MVRSLCVMRSLCVVPPLGSCSSGIVLNSKLQLRKVILNNWQTVSVLAILDL